MGGTLALPSRVPAPGAAVQRASAGLRRAHDWLQPVAVHALIGGYVKLDGSCPGPRCGPFPAPLHRGRRGVAGFGRPSPRATQRAATRHILKREFEVYGKPEFERLAKLSNGTVQPAPEPALRLAYV